MINVSDLPDEVLRQIQEVFEAEPRVRDMRVRQQMLQRDGRFAEALALAKRLEMLYNRCVSQYMQEMEDEAEKVDLKDIPMQKEDREGITKLLLVCFMCSDIIETSILDMNDILHRYDKDLNIELFNDIKQLMSMSKAKLKYLQKNGDYMKGMVWADKCDDMYAMIKNKATAIMKKTQANGI